MMFEMVKRLTTIFGRTHINFFQLRGSSFCLFIFYSFEFFFFSRVSLKPKIRGVWNTAAVFLFQRIGDNFCRFIASDAFPIIERMMRVTWIKCRNEKKREYSPNFHFIIFLSASWNSALIVVRKIHTDGDKHRR